MGTGESAGELYLILRKLRHENVENLSDYHRKLLAWSKNVDRRYAWVIVISLWIIMAASLGIYRIYGLLFARIVEQGYYTREEASMPIMMILTVETFSGPFVSVVNYYVSYRLCMLLGGILLVLGNSITAYSSSLVVDTIMLGAVQGLGIAFIFIPFLEANNDYFLKYRGISLGLAMSGGTISVFALEPLFKWLLDEYYWRSSYLAMAGISCIILLAAPFLKPNPQPIAPSLTRAKLQPSKLATCQLHGTTEQADTSSKFDMSLVWLVLKTPAFHLIWYIELLFYWVFSIYSLVLVDYAVDRGCSQEEAGFLLQFQSMGEIIGRVVFAVFLDMGPLRTRCVVILNLTVMAAVLAGVTQVSGYTLLASITTCLAANCSFINILVSKLLAEHLGERQVTLGYGLASFICGVFMILRPQVVGFFRDELGSYDLLMLSLAAACALAVVLWIVEPLMTRLYRK